LARDEQAASHFGLTVAAVQADMRDLSALDAGAFEVVYQPYSINFMPDVQVVFQEVARLLQPGGRYQLQFVNPFTLGVNPRAWTGDGYLLQQPYQDGAPLTAADEGWVYAPSDAAGPDAGAPPAAPPPREYRHGLGTVVNCLTAHGFSISRLTEQASIYPDPAAAPATWDHFVAYAPPWITVLCTYRPGCAG
jgi:SAM-dependent methyltransferase